jgi:hypothetical protein
MGLGIPEAVGITGTLAAAGLTGDEVHRWYGTARRELPLGLSPREYLELAPKGGRRVLELARRDVSERALGQPLDPAPNHNDDQRGA